MCACVYVCMCVHVRARSKQVLQGVSGVWTVLSETFACGSCMNVVALVDELTRDDLLVVIVVA